MGRPAIRPDRAVGALCRRSILTNWARRSSAITSPRSGAARTRNAAAIASSCSATSTRSARCRVAADIETALVIHDLMRAIGFDAFTIRVNNRHGAQRALANGSILADQSTCNPPRLDKLGKIGREQVADEMQRRGRHYRRAGRRRAQSGRADRRATTKSCGSSNRWWPATRPDRKASPGWPNCWRPSQPAACRPSRVRLDVSIARGLDYYTGTIFETFLDQLPGIGSVCSGGRYDNLAELYTNQELPGIGASLGLDRLLAAMEELGMLEKVATPAPVFVAYFVAESAARLSAAGSPIARGRLRRRGLSRVPSGWASSSNMPTAAVFALALIAGEDELAAGKCQIKDLANGQSRTVSLEAARSRSVMLEKPAAGSGQQAAEKT